VASFAILITSSFVLLTFVIEISELKKTVGSGA
jgi:hypothetical protein